MRMRLAPCPQNPGNSNRRCRAEAMFSRRSGRCAMLTATFRIRRLNPSPTPFRRSRLDPCLLVNEAALFENIARPKPQFESLPAKSELGQLFQLGLSDILLV